MAGVITKFLDGLFFPKIYKDGILVVDAPQSIEFAGAAVSVATVSGRTVVTIGAVGGALPTPLSGLLYNNAGLIGSSPWLVSGQGLLQSDSGAYLGIGASAVANTGYVRVGVGASASAKTIIAGLRADGGATMPLFRLGAFGDNILAIGTTVDLVSIYLRAATSFVLTNGSTDLTVTASDVALNSRTITGAGQIGTTGLVSSGVSHYAYSRITGVASPAQITTVTNDYAPTGLSTSQILRLDGDSGTDNILTGLDSTGLSAGAVRTLINVGTGTIYLAHAHTGSATNNRFNLGGHDITLAPDQAITLWLDVTGPNRWRPLGLVDQYQPTHGVTLADGDATLTADQGAIRRIPVLTANRTYDIDNTNAIDEETVTLVRTGAEAFTATIRDHANATIATFPASQKLKGRFRKAVGGNFVLVTGGFERVN